jgi:hypothetical protein
MGVVTATEIDSHARPRKVNTLFAQTVTQIVAVAVVGKVPSGSQLTIAWEAYDDSVAGVREMFEQRVRVSSFQRAYSTAVVHGRLTVGSYRVHVTLGGREIETPFNVAEQVHGRPPIGRPDDPEPGPSGTNDMTGESQPGGPCTSVTNVYGQAPGIPAEATIDGHPISPHMCGGGLTLAATVQGPYKILSADIGNSTVVFNPCDLPGGTGEPDSIVNVEGYTSGHESEAKHGTITLEDVNPFPLIQGSTDPHSGTRVKPGDTIHFRVGAVEVPWSAGVRSLTATTNIDNRVVQDKIDASKPCYFNNYIRIVDFVLTVPEKPPSVIEVRFAAVDFADRQDEQTLYYPTTGHLWKGTVHATASYITHVPSVHGIVRSGPYEGTYDGTLELDEDSQGDMSGHGTVNASGCEMPELHPATYISFEVRGTDNGKQLELQIIPSTFHHDGTECGFGYGMAVIPGTSPSSAVIPITAPGTAQGAWHGRAELPPSPPGPFSTASFTVDYQFALTCTDCQGSR